MFFDRIAEDLSCFSSVPPRTPICCAAIYVTLLDAGTVSGKSSKFLTLKPRCRRAHRKSRRARQRHKHSMERMAHLLHHWLVSAYTMSPTNRLNDSFSTNCLYTCVSSFKRCCITLPSA